MYICICNAVTERQVRACVDAGAVTLDDLQIDLGVATCCGTCAATASEYLPGGRCSSVCASVCHASAVGLPAQGVAIAAAEGAAANGPRIPIVAAA